MLVPSIFSDNFFDDFFEFPFIDDRAEKNAERKLYGHDAAKELKTVIKELEVKYQVEIDLPGFKKDEEEVELKDGYLVVSAEKGLDEDEQDKKTGKYLRRERYAGSCQRSYYVGKDTTEDDIKAHFEHGMLTVTVAKKEAKPAVEEKKHIAIEG